VCERCRKTCRPLAVAQVCLHVLTGPAADAGQCEQVARWLQEEADKDAGNSAFATPLAYVRSRQGRHDEAEAIYRKALAANPRDAMALNNLAYLLALKGGQKAEAWQKVQQAHEILGPRPSLLDTRGVVLMALGEGGRAVKDLGEAAAESSSGLVYFHLAQAHRMAGDRLAAATALRQAEALGLTAAGVHPLERTAYEQLTREFRR
jgi:Tfp pilus assembly protein PilF